MEQKLRRDRNMGDNLRKLRLDFGLSQEKLCAELQRRGCDIGRSTYEKYEVCEDSEYYIVTRRENGKTIKEEEFEN
jgi:transcriptional regulator with XRE-family HTH domain